MDRVIQDALDQQTFHVAHVNVELLRNERDVYSGVRFDEFDKYLSSNVPQKLLYVLSDERVVHYVTVICFQDFLKFGDVIVLVGAY